MSKEAIVNKITEIAERVAEPEGIEIVDVQLLGGGRARLLRIFIDKLEGVSHKECEFISHQVGTILDIEDAVRLSIAVKQDMNRPVPLLRMRVVGVLDEFE